MPRPSEGPKPAPVSEISNPTGASAAVVGREAALAAVAAAEVVDKDVAMPADVAELDGEIARLRALENELRTCVEQQASMESDELELEELELQVMELEYYMTEEEQLEKALKESMDEHIAREAEEAKSRSEAETGKGTKALPETKTGKNTDGDADRRKTPDDPAKIVPLDPMSKKLYVDYWARFVATPQNHGRSIELVKNKQLPPAVWIFLCIENKRSRFTTTGGRAQEVRQKKCVCSISIPLM